MSKKIDWKALDENLNFGQPFYTFERYQVCVGDYKIKKLSKVS